MDWEESLKDFEKLAVLLQNNCFEKVEAKCLKANYEIRSLVIIKLQGSSLLCYGDKSGSFWIVHRETGTKEEIEHKGVIDILDYKILPGNQALLFVVVRNMGIFVYRIQMTGNEIQCEKKGKIGETNGYIRFFYPHIVINPDNTIIRSEIWASLDNGNFLVFENKDLNNDETWQLKQRLDLPYALRGYAVDIDPGKPDGKGCFFIGNSVGDIFCLEFDTIGKVNFPASQEELEKQRILTIHSAFFEKMIPLSDYREGPAKTGLFYKNFYGGLALTGNKVICIYFEKKKGKNHLHTSTKVFPDQLLDIKCLPFDGFCWTVVSDNKKKLHFIKNVTDMNPPGRELELIYDGEFSSVEFEDRIFNLCTIPASTEKEGCSYLKYLGYLGMGNHSVMPIAVYDYEGKLNEAHELFNRFVDQSEAGTLDKEFIEPLNLIEKILDHFRTRSSRTAIKLLLLNLMKRMAGILYILILTDNFSRIFYKIIDNEKTDLIQRVGSFLLRLEKPVPILEAAINEFHTHIKKYILDGVSYSEKYANLRELWEYNENTGNRVDAIIYRGILYDRQYDPVAHFQFNKDNDGEITRIVPFKPFKDEKFIISTSKGKLFLADFQSMANKRPVLEYKKAVPGPETVLKINNLYMGKEKVFIFLSDPVIIVKKISELEAAANVIEVNDQDKSCIRFTDEKKSGTAVCQMPWDEEKGDEFFVGADQGDIFYLNPTVHSPQQVTQGAPDQASILDLRSFSAGGRYFLAAACRNGKIKIYECDRHNLSSIFHKIDIPVDTNAVTRVFVFCKEYGNIMEYPLLVAGTEGGKCFGIRLVINQNPGLEEKIKYVYEWCYRSENAVKGIHPFSLGKGKNYLLISSMDNHLHFLGFNGLCINTIQLQSPLLQVYMDTSPDASDPLSMYRTAYAISMDNSLQKLRFFVKSKILEEIETCFSGQRPGYEEFEKKDPGVFLLMFRTIDLKESHFRTRYYLKSNEFHSANQVLQAIDQILDHGKAEEDNDALVDLVRRLFSDFFDEILNDPEKYAALKKLFVKTRDQWGYPGLKDNSRAQLYWIRSMLKWCCQSKSKTPIERLNQWFDTGKTVAWESGLFRVGSIELLTHFISHPVPFLRAKTLQYFQTFIFNPKDRDIALDKCAFDDELVTTLSNAILNVLKMYRSEPNEGSPSWFEMEAVRFFSWMVLNYRYTGLCPARLCYDIWESNIASIFLCRLAEIIQICPGKVDERIEISNMLQAAGQLMQKLKRENAEIIDILPGLIRFCQSCKNHFNEEESPCKSKDNFCTDFTQFFTAIEKLLSLTKIEHFKNVPNFDEVQELTHNYFKGKEIIDAFIRLSRYIFQYYQEKAHDIYLLNVIQYPTFYQVKKSLADIHGMIAGAEKNTSWLENALYLLVWRRWDGIIDNELDNEVILDFARAIQNYKDTQLIYNEPMDMELIFKNIFTRLTMIAECDRSYLLYVEKKNRLAILHNDGKKEFSLSDKAPRLNEIPPGWLDMDTFMILADNDIHKQYNNDNHTHMFIKSPGIIPQKNSALYLFFWEKEGTDGLSRLKSREIIGEFITTVALLQVAMEEQREQKEEFFRIVSHELNQIIRGLLSWMSNLTAGYLENDPAMRMEYYERFQSSLVSADHVIRSLLTFRDSADFDIKACYLDKEIDQVVKNARAQYKDYGNITLNFNKEPGDYEIITEPALVGTAVMNLLTNARKYNPEKNPVDLMLKTVDQKIVIEVKDQGVGIPTSDYSIVFQLFKRGSFAINNSIDGLGVGLAISKKNIESLGGVIEFDSTLGGGTIFRIILNKRKFDKRHLLVTRVTVKKAPDFSAVKDIEKRKKLREKVKYNPNKNLLILRGVLTDEEYNVLKMCYLNDEKIKEFHLEALQKLHRESLSNLNPNKTTK